jgi:hypothetical protein
MSLKVYVKRGQDCCDQCEQSVLALCVIVSILQICAWTNECSDMCFSCSFCMYHGSTVYSMYFCDSER